MSTVLTCILEYIGNLNKKHADYIETTETTSDGKFHPAACFFQMQSISMDHEISRYVAGTANDTS